METESPASRFASATEACQRPHGPHHHHFGWRMVYQGSPVSRSQQKKAKSSPKSAMLSVLAHSASNEFNHPIRV